MPGTRMRLCRAAVAATVLPLLLGGCLGAGSGLGVRPLLMVERSGGPALTDDIELTGVLAGRRGPRARMIRVSTAHAWHPTPPKAQSADGLTLPVRGAVLTSTFGVRDHPILGGERMHSGIDLAAPTGTPILAAADGVVAFAGANGGYGNYVRLEHGRRLATAYAHMSRVAPGLAEGRGVGAGEVIGYVGSTGLSTGPHLHFEVLRDGEAVDPISMLPYESRLALLATRNPEIAQAARGGR